MSYAHRPLNANASANSNSNTSTTSLRHPAGSSSNSQSHSYLQTRINAKRAELTHLLELRDLSANLAGQLGTLEEKLSTLKDGTQSVALVLANWENVLRAIGMAASMSTSLDVVSFCVHTVCILWCLLKSCC